MKTMREIIEEITGGSYYISNKTVHVVLDNEPYDIHTTAEETRLYNGSYCSWVSIKRLSAKTAKQKGVHYRVRFGSVY